MKTFKELKGPAKLQFIWDYYKLPLVLIVLFLYIIGYIFHHNANKPFPELYLAYVNLEIGEDLNRTLTTDFIDQLTDAKNNSTVKTYQNLVLTDNLQNIDASFLQACSMKIIAAIDNEQLDLVLMNQEAFDAFAQNGYLMNLEDFKAYLPSNLPTSCLVENLEILSDNATEVLLDSSIAYQSETLIYPMGIDVSEFPCIKKAGFPDRVYLGVISNSPRSDQVAAYISYIFN